MRISVNPMDGLRKVAHQKVTDHFNRLAAETLHDDMVAIANGHRCGVHDRHETKSAAHARIDAAVTPEEITKALAEFT